MIKPKKMRWVGHVAHMGEEMRNAYKGSIKGWKFD
jgi:hypothetical protein